MVSYEVHSACKAIKHIRFFLFLIESKVLVSGNFLSCVVGLL